MNELLNVSPTQTNVVTMSSVELVEFINLHRREVATVAKPYVELLHKSFMAKVPTVLGEDAAAKFFATENYTNGTGGKVERKVYNFPKRESCLMAMSYSYELQAKVFDRMTELENQQLSKSKQDDFHPMTKLGDITEQCLKLATLFGFEGNQALLSADKATKKLTGYSPLNLLEVELIATKKEKIFTPTQLGAMLEPLVSGQKVNKLLENLGLQERVGDVWVVTELGSSYCELLDVGKKHSDGTPIKQVKWYESVLTLLE